MKPPGVYTLVVVNGWLGRSEGEGLSLTLVVVNGWLGSV